MSPLKRTTKKHYKNQFPTNGLRPTHKHAATRLQVKGSALYCLEPSDVGFVRIQRAGKDDLFTGKPGKLTRQLLCKMIVWRSL